MGIETLLIASAIGTGIQVAGQLKQGKQAEKLAEQKAAIELQNADAVRKAAVEETRIEQENLQRLLATQKSQAAAGGIRINVGSPLLIETETKNIAAKNMGFILERGLVEEMQFRDLAAISIAQGKQARKKSVFDALGTAITGFGSIAFLGIEGGIFGKKTVPLASTSTLSTQAGRRSIGSTTRNFPQSAF